MPVTGPLRSGVPQPLRWTAERYLLLIESGIIVDGALTELVDGEVVESVPQGNRHFQTFRLLQEAFRALGVPGLIVSPTIQVSEFSVVDPEFALIRQSSFNHLPTASETVWVVEVSDSSLQHDLTVKEKIYAEAGIPVYWVVNVNNRQIHVFTNPINGRYSRCEIQAEFAVVPVDGQNLSVADLFPAVD